MKHKQLNVLKATIENDIKSKRHRRTKAEMEAYRASLNKIQPIKISNNVEKGWKEKVLDLKNEDKPKKRHRRTKAEMEAYRASLNKNQDIKLITNSSENLKSKIKVTKKGNEILKFKNYIIKKYDDKNIELCKCINNKSLFLGYYSSDNILQCLEKIGNQLLYDCTDNSNVALTEVNKLIIAITDFKIFLQNHFK